MTEITFDDFLKVELRVGRVVSAEPVPPDRVPDFSEPDVCGHKKHYGVSGTGHGCQ